MTETSPTQVQRPNLVSSLSLAATICCSTRRNVDSSTGMTGQIMSSTERRKRQTVLISLLNEATKIDDIVDDIHFQSAEGGPN
jgi:hypothetical protein